MDTSGDSTAARCTGFLLERSHNLNRAGTLPWLVFGKLLGRERINKLTLKIFDKTVWLWRRIDPLMPWPGLSYVVVARKI